MILKTITNPLTRYLKSGVSDKNSEQRNQQIVVFNLFSTMGYSITFLLGISALFGQNFILAAALLLSSALFFTAFQLHRFKRIDNPYVLSTRIVLVVLFILMIYLVISGGHKLTGPLWIYIVPPIAFFFRGMRGGLTMIGLFIILVSFLFFYQSPGLLMVDYSYEFKSRIVYSFLTVTLLFGFYEYSRQKSFRYIQELSQKFEQQAMHDPLTQLANRRGMREYLDYEYKRSKRSKTDMSLLLCDIDHFKKVNDTYGHDAGDYVLEQLAQMFTGSLRGQDKISRWGGEEFLFLLPETNGFEAYTLAEKIRKSVDSATFKFNQTEIKITVSIGLKEVTRDLSIDKAISLADYFLYQAKEQGRNKTLPEKRTL